MRHRQSKTVEPSTAIFSSALGRICEHASRINRAQSHILKHVAANMRQFCRVANVTKTKVVIEVANGTFLTRLKYDHSYMLRNLQADGLPELQLLEFKVNPALRISEEPISDRAKQKQPVEKTISKETASKLIKASENLPPKIQACFARVAERAQS